MNRSLLGIAVLLVWLPPAWANCLDGLGHREALDPIMQRLWLSLMQQTTYPWGPIQPFDRFEDDTISLTQAFDYLSSPEKGQVLNALHVYSLHDVMTPEEQQRAAATTQPLYAPYGMPPYRVVAYDGRLISNATSGCDRNIYLTEYLRHLSQVPRGPRRFPLASLKERAVKARFWQAVGTQNPHVEWISWVPEQGHFEINLRHTVPAAAAQASLRRFWPVAPRPYRYRVLEYEGGWVTEYPE